MNPVHKRRLARIQKGKVETVETVPTTGIITDVQTFDEFDEYTKEELDDKTKDVVIEIAEKLELDTDGSKLEIIKRILDNYNSITTEEDEEDEENNEN